MNIDEKLAMLARNEQSTPFPVTNVSAWVLRSIRTRGAEQARTMRIFAIASGLAAMLMLAVALSQQNGTTSTQTKSSTNTYASLKSDAEAYVFADLESNL